MKKYLKIILIIFLMGLISLSGAEDKKPVEKKEKLKPVVRSAKMISELDVSASGTPSFLRRKQRIIRQMRKISKSSKSEVQKKYFDNFIKCLKDEKFDTLPEVKFISGTQNDLLIKYDRKNKALSAIALRVPAEENKSIEDLFGKIRNEIEKGILGRNVRFFPQSNVIKIAEVIYPETLEKRVIVLPPAEADSGIYPGVILLTNKIEKNFEDDIKPLSQQILNKKIYEGLNAGLLSRNIFLHHVAHYTIPFSIKKDGEKREFKGAGLKDLFSDAEEIRADLNYLKLIALMDEKELLEEGVKEEVIYIFILQKMAEMKDNALSGTNHPSTVIINSLYKRGGIGTNKNGKKLVVDIDLLVRNIKSLEIVFEDIIQKGNHGECKIFFKKYSKMPENLKKLLKISTSKKAE